MLNKIYSHINKFVSFLGVSLIVYSLYPFFLGSTMKFSTLFQGMSILFGVIFVRQTPTFVKTKSYNKILFKKTIYLFILLFMISLIFLFISIYERSVYFFISSSLLVIPIIIQITNLKATGSQTNYPIIIAEIILFSFLMRLSSIFVYPFSFGNLDYIYHVTNIDKIMTNGNFESIIGVYNKLPFYHLIVGITSSCTSITSYLSGYLTMVSIFQISIITTFLLIKNITRDVKLSLITIFLLVVARDNLYWGSMAVPQSLGYVIIILCLYSLFLKKYSGLCFLFFGFTLLLSNIPMMNYFIVLLLLLICVDKFSFILYKKQAIEHFIKPRLFILLIGGATIYYVFVCQTPIELINLIVNYDYTQPPPISLPVTYNIITIIFDQADLLIMLFFFTIGFLIFTHNLNNKYRSFMTLLFLGVFLSPLYFPNPLMNMSFYMNLEGWRAGLIIEFFIILIISIGVANLLKHLPHKRIIVICMLLTLLAFFGSTNSQSSPDKPLFGIISPSTYFTNSELKGYSFFSDYCNHVLPITLDKQTFTYFKYYYPTISIRSLESKETIVGGNFTLFLYRSYRNINSALFVSIDEANVLYGRMCLLKFNETDLLSLNQYDTIYFSNAICIYYNNLIY